jgi:arylsulfatase
MTMGSVVCGALLGWLAASFRHGFEVRAQNLPPANAPLEKAGNDPLDRTVLPIPEPRRPPITQLDVRNAKAPPRFEVKAPSGAPNVLIVLIDDMGFGQPSA